MLLDGKSALITGSSRGIGRAIALKLAQHGVKVATHYYMNEAAANDTLSQVRQRGTDGFILQADITKPEDVNRMFSQVRDNFGKLDIFRDRSLKFPKSTLVPFRRNLTDKQLSTILLLYQGVSSEGTGNGEQATGKPTLKNVGRRPPVKNGAEGCVELSVGVIEDLV